MSKHDERDIPLMALDQYMRAVRWTEPLAEEEEATLLRRVERGKQERLAPCPNQWVLSLARHARDRLVEAYQPLVIAVAKKYRWLSESMVLEDLIQEGNIGLLEAIEANDTSKGLPLRMLAARCIGHAIWRALRRCDRLVHAPERSVDALARLRQVKRRLVVRFDREPTGEELAAEMGISVRQVRDLLALYEQGRVESLQGLLQEDDAEDRHDFARLYEAAVAAETARQRELEQAVQQALETALTPRQREVMSLRYGLDGETGCVRTITDVAALCGLAYRGVESTEYRAKVRLRQVLAPVCRTAQDETCA
jgi:RNA polymerase sigma factor (sigma-70 family)